MIQIQSVSDQHIFRLIQEGELSGWGHLYDKYSPLMYGIICSLTKDGMLADKILIAAFLELRKKQIISLSNNSLCASVIKHTHLFATEQLKDSGTKISKVLAHSTPIYLLYTQCRSIKEVSVILNITEKEAKRVLQIEFEALRN